MSPRLLVERLFEEQRDDDETYIIIYSTKERHPPGDFYRNLRRLRELADIKSPVRGVLICRGSKAAKVAYDLARKYCGRAPLTFRVVEAGIFREEEVIEG